MTTHKTKGIVLRTVKYGETSVIATLYTELFGLQSYLVNGVRSTGRQGGNRAGLFQPAAILELVVYHNDLKNLQRMREYRWGVLYEHLYFDVWKNAVAVFMIELLQKTIRQPEPHPDLFAFIEDSLLHLDAAAPEILGNYPLFFALHLASFFGLKMSDNWSPNRSILDLREGAFVAEPPEHAFTLREQTSYLTSQLLKAQHPAELSEIRMNREIRKVLLRAYESFYALHLPEFGSLKTLPVLWEILQ